MITLIKKIVGNAPVFRGIKKARYIYRFYNNSYKIGKLEFLLSFFPKIYVQKKCNSKTEQIVKLINKIDIEHEEGKYFFYSIDCFKSLETSNQILDNYSVDYNLVVNGSIKDIENKLLLHKDDYFSKSELELISALYSYLEKCKREKEIAQKYSLALDAIASLFERPAETFFEGLQRILFFNQFLWQTGHKHNGLGRLDQILIDLYSKDIKNGTITKTEADEMLCEFFNLLHKNCWFKSTMLLGDTGQIIILGGLNEKGIYCANELTYKFIEISMKLKLPDPKVLLRCCSDMPEDLLELALKCISTGIGAPFLSNDEAVIPALISFGYAPDDAYNYVTSACWEPLIAGKSCDQNNIKSLNFAKPFVNMLNNCQLETITGLYDLMEAYKQYLADYLDELLSDLSKKLFEEDPLLSLLSETAIKSGKDIVRGGARYANMGLTSIGMDAVINSLISINKLVFVEKRYTLTELNEYRKNDYKNNTELLDELNGSTPFYGSDDELVINLTNAITKSTSQVFKKYSTKLGGHFKFGLSSPQYINEGKNTEATFDGRKSGEPFGVHISSKKPLPVTELLSFATRLDYSDNKLNGNVVDFFVTPKIINENINKFVSLLRSAFKNGLYQLQMNVVSSATLIDAKRNPEKFPDLVVRVWGFSAYFNDLPLEYKDLLIKRALESEKCA